MTTVAQKTMYCI